MNHELVVDTKALLKQERDAVFDTLERNRIDLWGTTSPRDAATILMKLADNHRRLDEYQEAMNLLESELNWGMWQKKGRA